MVNCVVDFEKVYADCTEWLNGKDKAQEELEKAHAIYERAKANAEAYTPEEIERVAEYTKRLGKFLGYESVDKPEEQIETESKSEDEQTKNVVLG